MGYSEVLSRRIPYDINGTAVGYRASSTYSNGLSDWLSSSQLGELNDEDLKDMERVRREYVEKGQYYKSLQQDSTK